MRIEIWADPVCPWAYIGKRRLERALEGWTEGSAEVVWRPYRIDPTAPTVSEPIDEVMRDPFVEEALRSCGPESGDAAEGELFQVSELAAAEGIEGEWGAAWRANTHDAHRLLALAEEEGGPALQGEVAERLLRAHFVEGRDIADHAVLAAIAADAGSGRGGELSADSGDRRVRELLLIGKAEGVRTSPTFVVNGMSLTGAQDPALIVDFLTEAAARRPRELPEEVERMRRAEALLALRDPLGTLELLGPLMDEHGADPAVRLLAARAYFHSAQLGRARRALEEIVSEGADDAYAHLLLGRTLQRQGERESAEPHLRLAAVMDPALA